MNHLKNLYRNRVLVAAHRGNSRYYPENTMPAFESVLTLDIDMIENDLHMTRDGQIIVMHDQKVDRTTDGTGDIRDMTLAELKKLDAGSWKGKEFEGTRVPTLVEFLELVKDRKDLLFNIELKDYPHQQGERAYESCDRSLAMLEEYGIAERCVINSWSGELLEYIDRKYDHRYCLHGYFPITLMGQRQTRDPYDYLYCICLFDKEKGIADKEHFDYAAERGVEPWVFFSKEEEETYRLAVERGAVLFTANDPKRADEILKKLKVR